MELVTLPKKQFVGLKIRTTNEEESTAGSNKIQGVWTDLWQNVIGKDLPQAPMVYGIYHDYESDKDGLYSLLVGIERPESFEGATNTTSKIESIETIGGNYAVFRKSGPMPDVVVETWQEIHDFFDDAECPYKRSYKTDIEEFPSGSEVVIYVGVA